MEKRKVNMVGIILAVQYLSYFPSLLRGWIESMSKDGTDNKVILAQVNELWRGPGGAASTIITCIVT